MSSAVDAAGSPHFRCVVSDDRVDAPSGPEATLERAAAVADSGVAGSPAQAGHECGSTTPAMIEVLLAREQARHHAELSATEGQLREAAGRAPASVVEQLRTDLSLTGAAVITALEHLTLATEAEELGQEIDVAVERAAPALRTAAAALHSALTCHLSIEARLHAPRGQAR